MNLPLTNTNMQTVSYWINQMTSVDTTFKIDLFTGTDGAVTISGQDIADTLYHDYGNFYAYSCESLVDFIFEYTRFKRIHLHDFERIYKALYTNYEPLENYNKQSTISDSGTSGADAEHPFTSYAYQVADDTVSNQNPYIPQTKVTTDGLTTSTNTRTENTHGNIGVTKSTDMLRDEINTRVQHNMIETVVRMFAEMELI